MNEEAHLSPLTSMQKFAIDIAYRLSSLRDFLEASEDLCRYNEQLTDADIQRHGRKLLAIMEVARSTLNLAGVKLHLFTSCPPKYQPHKSAYFRMLVLIVRQNQDRFPAGLQGRVNRLLLPLTTRLFIWHNRDPYAQLGIADLMHNLNNRSRPQGKPPLEDASNAADSLRVPPWPLNNIAASMPPPDAFPSKVTEDKRRKRALLDSAGRRSRGVHKQYPARSAQRLVRRQCSQVEQEQQRLVPKQYPARQDPDAHRAVHRRNSAQPEPEVEPMSVDEDSVASRLPTHAFRLFGIFCTGNNRQSQQLRR